MRDRIKLRDLTVARPDHVWCTDITYVPMPGGHAYLCAVMDWYSRKVLGWAVSNTMETGLCLEALENALAATGRVPEIFNTDQGCQFTSAEWMGRLTDLEVKISMDGTGRWMDNVFIERLWRSVKYEEIYLFEHSTLPALRQGLTKWFGRYNDWRPHETLGNLTPAVAYQALRIILGRKLPSWVLAIEPSEANHPSARREFLGHQNTPASFLLFRAHFFKLAPCKPQCCNLFNFSDKK